MGKNSRISWTDHTFNPWMGCTKVSPGCKNCYAERDMDHRFGRVKWGPQGVRIRTSAANWRKPLAWNRQAEKEDRRFRVFCASLADVFEDKPDQPEMNSWRADLFRLIQATPNLDWLLLTKRPEKAWEWFAMLYQDEQAMERVFDSDFDFMDWVEAFNQQMPIPNIWLGTSIENQATADERIPALLSVPAAVRFLSVEPLLGPVDLWGARYANPTGGLTGAVTHWSGGVDWVIVGGESGPNARPMHPDWVRGLRDQCQNAGVPFFFKQWGEYAPREWEVERDLSIRKDGYDGWWYGQDGVNCRKVKPQEWRDGRVAFAKVGKKAAGRLLDGREWNEFPHPTVKRPVNNGLAVAAAEIAPDGRQQVLEEQEG